MTNIARDIKLFFNPNTKGEFADIEIDSGDFVLDQGLETMILLSLFCDAFVTKEKSLTGETRGWFGNLILGFNLGSKLWLLDRAKADKKTLVLMAQYAKEALEWMVTEGIVAKIETHARKAVDRTNAVELFIAVYKPDGSVEGFKYNTQWEAQKGSV